MLFNSTEFLLFFPIVFCLYWFIAKDNLRFQNIIIVVASYFFYGWWDWRFLFLIAFSTLIDFLCGKALEKENKRKMYLWISIITNIGLLGVFKYFNFFVSSFVDAFSLLGVSVHSTTLSIILPVGISFYTFQTLSYTIDVFKRKTKATNDFIAFAAFVSFFPQLVAGPIERASHFLPQFITKRKFDYVKAIDGLKQMLWGFFKKIVIADNCAEYADMIFNHSENYSGSTLVLGAFFFAFQIYGDFSGYSDIAIGLSRLFGFDLMKNFSFPFFSRNIGEFWKRWHISLSTWFRDYVYIPLGGSRISTSRTIQNTFIVFLVSGLWHGSNWTYVIWGTLHALFFIPLIFLNKSKKYTDLTAPPQIKDFFSILLTFSLTTFAWIFFRAESLSHAKRYISDIFTYSLFHQPEVPGKAVLTLGLICFFVAVEWIGRTKHYAIQACFKTSPQLIRWGFYAFLLLLIGLYMQTEETPFIYFQF